jgi:putative membrane protein insertion efficiency factor
MKIIILKLIRVYQATLSPDHGWFKARHPYGFCRFYPSCSQYAYEAVDKHGIIQGSILAALRVVRCNPFTQPKIDKI